MSQFERWYNTVNRENNIERGENVDFKPLEADWGNDILFLLGGGGGGYFEWKFDKYKPFYRWYKKV